MTLETLEDTLKALGAALKPQFDAERAAWAEHGPAVTDRATLAGIAIDHIGGNCPVQAEGSFDGKRFYFRARGGAWQFHVWPAERAESYLKLPFDKEEFVVQREYGDGPFDAGWMPRHEAVGFICDGVAEYRAQQVSL